MATKWATRCYAASRAGSRGGPLCSVARLGGEEFGLLTIGMEGIVLDRFAESIRREIAACDHVDLLGERRVTASVGVGEVRPACDRSEEHTSELQSLMRHSYAVFCLKKKTQ